MKKWFVVGSIVVMGIVGYLVLSAAHLMWKLDHVVLSSSLSPDGKHVARLYAVGEGDTPPTAME